MAKPHAKSAGNVAGFCFLADAPGLVVCRSVLLRAMQGTMLAKDRNTTWAGAKTLMGEMSAFVADAVAMAHFASSSFIEESASNMQTSRKVDDVDVPATLKSEKKLSFEPPWAAKASALEHAPMAHAA